MIDYRLILGSGILSLLFFCCCCDRNKEMSANIIWNNEISLPPCKGMDCNKGLAGTYAGFVGDYLVVAGGANFPDKYPWEGGSKVWWNTMYSYNRQTGEWKVYDNFLDKPLAYGITFQIKEGLLCIGGNNANRCYNDVFLIREKNKGLVVEKGTYPSLPIPLSNLSGTLLDGKIYIAGGQESMIAEKSTNHFLVMDIDNPSKGWYSLPKWPGATRAYSVCVSQGGKVYLFSGRSFGLGEGIKVQTDGYCYDPDLQKWNVLNNKFPVMAGNAIAYEEDKILFFGGVESMLAGSICHPGFSRKVRIYDLKKNVIEEVAECPYPLAVTTPLISDVDTIYIVSGEIKPGIRTPYILRAIL